jgi:hypothetical protein
MFGVVIGLVLLLSHLATTWSDERRLIWSARSSFTKYAFLLYRYLVPVVLIFEFVSQSGFTSIQFDDKVRSFLRIFIYSAQVPRLECLGMRNHHPFRCCYRCDHANTGQWSGSPPCD